jgi:hypothetical protein
MPASLYEIVFIVVISNITNHVLVPHRFGSVHFESCLFSLFFVSCIEFGHFLTRFRLIALARVMLKLFSIDDVDQVLSFSACKLSHKIRFAYGMLV